MNIESRLGQLENKYIRLRRITVSLCLFGLLFILVAANTPDNEIITAKAFVVLDNKGNIRQIFGPNLSKTTPLRLDNKSLERYRNYINSSDDNRDVGRKYGMEIFNERGTVRAEITHVPHNRREEKGRYNKDQTYIHLYDEEKIQTSFMKPYFSVRNRLGAELKLTQGNWDSANLEVGNFTGPKFTLSTTRGNKKRGNTIEKYLTSISASPFGGGLNLEYGGRDMAGLRLSKSSDSESRGAEFYINDYLTTSDMSLSMNNSKPEFSLSLRKQSRSKYKKEYDAANEMIRNLQELEKQQLIIWKKYHSGGNHIVLKSKYGYGPAVELWENGVERIHFGSMVLKKNDGSPLPRTSASIVFFNEKKQVIKLIP